MLLSPGSQRIVDAGFPDTDQKASDKTNIGNTDADRIGISRGVSIPLLSARVRCLNLVGRVLVPASKFV